MIFEIKPGKASVGQAWNHSKPHLRDSELRPCFLFKKHPWVARVLQGNSRSGDNEEDYQRVVKSYKSKRLNKGGKTGPEEKAALWHAVHPPKIPVRKKSKFAPRKNFCNVFERTRLMAQQWKYETDFLIMQTWRKAETLKMQMQVVTETPSI